MQTTAMNISSTDTHTAAIGAPRVLIAAGGTGGHVYPAIAIGDALRRLDPETNLLFVGTKDRMEARAVPSAGYEFKTIWISGFHRNLTPVNLLFPVKLVVSLIQSTWLLRQFRPDIVVSCGGFASGPIGWVAARLGIPLVIQEQNSYPGITTRFLARHAQRIFTAFPSASDYLKSDHIVQTGNPLRTSLESIDRSEAAERFGFDPRKKTVLVMGGSGGARSINQAMESSLRQLHDKAGLQIIWQCGERYYDELKERIVAADFPDLRLTPFIDDMPAAYGCSNLVISRSGALSCSELMLTGKPAVLIPSPNVAGDHQNRNAESMVEAGAAILIEDQHAESTLADLVIKLLGDPERLAEMSTSSRRMARPDAAAVIAKQINELVEKEL